MAKELPYFKFEPNQWENGQIQMLSREEKGLFIDLCSIYWSRLGDVPLKLAVQKLCGGNATAFDSLTKEHIFTVIDGQVCIDFLNEQLLEFENISEQNSKNAKDGWEKRRKNKASKRSQSDGNAVASNPQCENDAIRGEESKEDKIKEDEIIKDKKEKEKKFVFRKSLIDLGFKDDLVSDWLIVRKNKKASNTKTSFKLIEKEVLSTSWNINEVMKMHVERSWSGFKVKWYENELNGAKATIVNKPTFSTNRD